MGISRRGDLLLNILFSGGMRFFEISNESICLSSLIISEGVFSFLAYVLFFVLDLLLSTLEFL